MASDDQIGIIAQVSGPLYLRLRDTLLRRGGDLAALPGRHGADPDWRVRISAAILAGWAAHRDLYTQVNAALGRIDPSERGRTITGITGIWEEWEMRAHVDHGAPILPLAWEGIVKLANGAPPWRTATFLAMIAGVPQAASIEPVVHLIETSGERLLHERAGLTLAKLPRAEVEPRLARLTARAAGITTAVQTARDWME